MQTTDYSGATVPSIGSRVMHCVDYDIGTVVDRVEIRPMHNPDELLDPPELST